MLFLDILREILFGTVWSAVVWVPALGTIVLTLMVEQYRRQPEPSGAREFYDWQEHGL